MQISQIIANNYTGNYSLFEIGGSYSQFSFHQLRLLGLFANDNYQNNHK